MPICALCIKNVRTFALPCLRTNICSLGNAVTPLRMHGLAPGEVVPSPPISSLLSEHRLFLSHDKWNHWAFGGTPKPQRKTILEHSMATPTFLFFGGVCTSQGFWDDCPKCSHGLRPTVTGDKGTFTPFITPIPLRKGKIIVWGKYLKKCFG